MPDDDPDTIDFGEGSDNPAPPYERDDEPAWDSANPRRRHDQFAPPQSPCECYCLHCNRVFMSDQIWFQRVIGDPKGFEGFWMCPTPNCGGAGFTFDIFPTDPNHPANAGWQYYDDGDYSEEEFEPMLDAESDADAGEWDPEEPLYKSMDDHDDDIEGEEWKYGLEPGAPLPESLQSDAQRAWEEEQKRYDAPDERPRELDWSNREDREGPITEDDIPF